MATNSVQHKEVIIKLYALEKALQKTGHIDKYEQIRDLDWDAANNQLTLYLEESEG